MLWQYGSLSWCLLPRIRNKAGWGAPECLCNLEETDFQFTPWLVESSLGPGAWRFRSDLGGRKSQILGAGFRTSQHTDYAGECWAFWRDRIRVLGSSLQRSPCGKKGAATSVHVCRVLVSMEQQEAGKRVLTEVPCWYMKSSAAKESQVALYFFVNIVV